ncbi:MAG: hypothetical protein MJZ13_03915 [Bacteroidales bacterium]|nr:hypothetical protein [Bacteroidales bacterium]
MRPLKQLFFILLLAISAAPVNAASNWCDTLNVSAELSISGATNSKLHPLWSYSQEWGKYTQYKQGEALVHLKADYRIANFRYFTMHAGLGVVGKSELKRSMIHEAYLAGKLFIFDYTAGMQAFSPLAQYDRMTSGNFLMSSNARPTPRIGVGLFDYWSVPYTHDWIQLKGGMYIGRLFNEDYDKEYTKTHTKDVLFHEKFAYLRLGGWYAKPYLGLTHSVMMGGTLADGTKLPIDFWSSFVAKGSQQFTGKTRGEATNAAGGHQGLWDAGLDIDFDAINATVYCKRPFTDATGKKYFDERSGDFYLGTVITLPKSRFIKSFSIEWMKTSKQGGEGTPDPIGLDKYGKEILLYPGDYPEGAEAITKWMYEHFDKDELDEWAAKNGPYEDIGKIQWFLEHKWNHGLFFGGRSNCLSNSYYPQGWTVEGHTMSSAYFHTQQTVDIYGSEYAWQHLVAVPNYRINAITMAINGNCSDKISYFLKIGVTKNHGNLIEKYDRGAYSWTLAENYYFKTSKKEYYTTLSVDYKFNSGLSLKATYAGDFGDLYKSTGLRLSAIYTLNK